MNEVFLHPYGFKLISQLPTLYLLQPQQHYQSTNIYSTKHIKKTYLWTAAQLLLSSSKGYKNFAILCLCNDCLSSCSDDTVSIFNRRSCARCTCDFCFRTISNAIPRYFTLMCQWVGSLFPSLKDILFATRFTGSFSVVTDFLSKRILLWTPYTDTKIPSKQHNTTLD